MSQLELAAKQAPIHLTTIFVGLYQLLDLRDLLENERAKDFGSALFQAEAFVR
ncbi:protein of unknown function (plasmid) [Cupriavidus taiwanensis]|uniref:Uncharacterized protein n=1 Tax=Cupriavidus taiwanensis TaxID=164546 RepID=A0A375FI15_9BURK|nr:protein of unknown function [Cupriavidus taiwanensis]SPA11460.1 protein of unknown function [Cupriavidus taiwanensis]SPA57368.1 protein of unknown function [Cupriavidus taiwanensis]SPD49192.1 protein of unknown function [Cupriavidus taiwanensis]